MFYLLLPLQFLCVTVSLNEGVNLVRSLLFVLLVTVLAIVYPEIFKAKNKFVYLLLALPGIYIIAAIANKQNPILALVGNYNRNFGVFTFIAVGILVLITSNAKFKTTSFMNYGVWPTTALSIFYSYMQSFDLDPLAWSESDRTVLTLGNSDYAASFLAMLIVAPIYGFFYYSNKWIKAAMVPLLWLILNAGLNSQAYQFRVIALVSVFSFLIVFFWEKIISIPKVLSIGSLFALIGYGTYFVLSNKAELISRTSFEDRISQQKMGISMFTDHPIFGVGIDQMSRYMPMYLKPVDILKNSVDVIPDKTHNVFIDHLAHGGFLAGLIFTAFIIFSLVLVIKLMNNKNVKENRSTVALLASIWVAYVAQQFISTDHIFLMIMPFMAFGLICKLNYSEVNLKADEKVKFDKNIGLALRSLMSFFLVIVVLVGGRAVYFDSQVKKILSHEIMNGDVALNVIKSFPNPKTTEAIIVDAMSNLGNCPFAIAASDELLKLDDRSSQAWYVKTLCADATGDLKTASNYLDKAIAFQPVNTRYLEAKVKLLVALGDKSSAEVVLQRIISINPNLPNLSDLEALLKVPATK